MIFILLTLTSLVLTAEAVCDYGSSLPNKGVGGTKIQQITTRSSSNPEWMGGRSFSENVQRCKEACDANPKCNGLQFSPTYFAHEECFLMTGEPYTRSGWKSEMKQCNANRVCKPDPRLSDKGIGGKKLKQITTAFLSNPNSMQGRSFAQNIELCRKECSENPSCAGLQYSPTYWDHQECFLMDGAPYKRSGWSSEVFYCGLTAKCSYNSNQFNKGVSGNVLRQLTTKFSSNPKAMGGRSYEENIDRCKEACLKDPHCKGLQFSPTSWDHQECFLMDGSIYSRSNWKSITKNC